MTFYTVHCPGGVSFSLPEPLLVPALFAGNCEIRKGLVYCDAPGPDHEWETLYVHTAGNWTHNVLIPFPIIRQFLRPGTFTRAAGGILEYHVAA